MRPTSAPCRRYTREQLLAESDYSQPLTAEEREWVAGGAVGREFL